MNAREWAAMWMQGLIPMARIGANVWVTIDPLPPYRAPPTPPPAPRPRPRPRPRPTIV